LLTPTSSLTALEAHFRELRELGENHIQSLEGRCEQLAAALQTLQRNRERDAATTAERISALEALREDARRELDLLRRDQEALRQSHASELGQWDAQRLALIADQREMERRCEELERQLAAESDVLRLSRAERAEAAQEAERLRQELAVERATRELERENWRGEAARLGGQRDEACRHREEREGQLAEACRDGERLRQELAVERATRELERENWRGEAARLGGQRDEACRRREEMEVQRVEAGLEAERQREQTERLRLEIRAIEQEREGMQLEIDGHRQEKERLQAELAAVRQTLEEERAGWLVEKAGFLADRDQVGQEALELREVCERQRRELETARQGPPPAFHNLPSDLPDGGRAIGEVGALEQQLRRQRERAELLQRQVQELQEQLEHCFPLAQGQPGAPRESSLSSPVTASLSPAAPAAANLAGEAATINGNRSRLLAAP
jgi:hypothetical protein